MERAESQRARVHHHSTSEVRCECILGRQRAEFYEVVTKLEQNVNNRDLALNNCLFQTALVTCGGLVYLLARQQCNL